MQDVSTQILRYLKNYSSKDKPIPTTKLAELFTTNSRTSINYYLKKLEATGKVRRAAYATISGSGLWYIPSSKSGDTVVYEVSGHEFTWASILQLTKSQPNNPYARELAEIMDYISVISRMHNREEMLDALESVKNKLTTLSIKVSLLHGIVDTLKSDPVLRDPDTLSELKLERL